MVRIDRIYTRSGDAGQTSLGDGSRVEKTDQRIAVMGSVDEVNSHLGQAAACSSSKTLTALLEQLQQLLFDLGADLCCPADKTAEHDACPRIAAKHVTWLEQRIDEWSKPLSPLNSFILPGGSPCAAALHVSRAVCRRAEREFLRLLEHSGRETVNEHTGVFLNRLSDLLFVLARAANDNGQADVLWDPARSV